MMRASVFRLSPLLLLAAALVALAVLLVHDSPPAAADHTVATPWSATLTVQDVASGVVGCNDASGVASTYCSATSVLTDNDFTYNGVDYEVDEVVRRANGNLVFRLDKAMPSGLTTLNVGGTEFSLASATLSNSNKTVTWTNSGLSWSAGDTVSLSLTEDSTTPHHFAISNATAYQGGDAVLCIALSLARSVTFNVTTNLASNDSSASASDVGTVPSTVTASTTTPCDNTLTIPISAATANEPRESFQVTITSQNSQFSPAQTGANVATVVIPEQTYLLYDVAVEEGETAVADVILTSPAPSGGLSFTVSANLAGSNTSSADVGTIPSTVQIAAGEKRGTLSIPTVDDNLREESESFQVVLSETYADWYQADGYGFTVTILSSDIPPGDGRSGPEETGVTLSSETLTVTEGGSGAFTVALSADPGANTTVTLAKTQYNQPGVGQRGHRWNVNAASLSPETLTFTAGTSGNWGTAQTVTVTAPEDADSCHEQLVVLVLSGGEPVGGTSNAVAGVFVTVTDNDGGTCGGL